MKLISFAILFIVLLSIFSVVAYAEENVTVAENLTTPEVPQEEPQQTPQEDDEPSEPSKPRITFELVNVTPKSVKQGDVLLSLTFRNTGTVKIENLVPLIVARGFSTYDVVPIPVLERSGTATAFISGSIAESGELLLTIKARDQVFYDKISVASRLIEEDDAVKKTKEEEKRKRVLALSQQVQDLKTKLDVLERQYHEKKEKYEVTEVDLDPVKKYLQEAQSKLLSGEVLQANISLVLGFSEYDDQEIALTAATKKPLLQRMKENVVLLSGIAAGIITLFSFYELVRKKQESITKKISEIKGSKEEKKDGKKKKKV